MIKNIFNKNDIEVIDSFIEKISLKYIELRNVVATNISSISERQLYESVLFDATNLKNIIMSRTVPHDIKRDKGETPSILNDIYRSDLGELLTTLYFEEEFEENLRYVIPLKNISYRELPQQPGRGIDVIGYKITDTEIEVLLGEAKVSEEQTNPPQVVDKTSDSIYNTQKSYSDDINKIITRLSDYFRRLGARDAVVIGTLLINMENGISDKYKITLGCSLIRDYSCVNEKKDFGKMMSDQADFGHNKIHFSIISFSNCKIEDTVQKFYLKVQELIK